MVVAIQGFFLFFLQLLLAQYTRGATVAPTWVTSSYIQAASYKVINGDLCNCVTGNNTTPTATINFASAFPSIPNLGYGISSYQGNDTTIIEQFEVNRTALSTTSYSIAIQIHGTTNIWIIQVRYIAISKLFPHHVNSFDNVPVNYTYGPLVNISVSSSSVTTFTNVINYTNQATASGSTYKTFSNPLTNNKILLFMTSLYIFGTYDLPSFFNSNPTPIPLNLTINADPVSTSSYKLEVIFGLGAHIQKLHFSMIIFDQYEVQLSGQYSIVYSKIFMTTATYFYSFPSQFLKNFMVGFLSFNSDKTGKCINFVNTFGVVSGSHGLSKSLSTARNNYDPITGYVFNVFYLKTWICPNNTFLDQTNNMCTDCSLTGCIVCLNLTACAQCNSTINYFINSSTQTCSICSIQGCVTCSSLTTCTSCNGGLNYILVNNTCTLCNSTLKYFVNTTSNTCQLCTLYQCLTCSSLTACSACNTTNNYYLNGSTCSYCDPAQNKFMNGTTCQLCTLSQCLTCSSLTACSACNTTNNYYLNGSTCSYCDPAQNKFMNGTTCQLCTLSQCLTCSSLTACSACNTTNNYYLNGSTCSYCDPAQNKFMNGTTCQLCTLSQCLTCSSLTACSACNTTNNYYLNGSTCSYCDPAQNKFMNGTTCQLCTLSQCLTCSSLTACSACNTTNNYYLNGSTCSYCDPAQNKFMNGTTCQLCTLSQCLTCSSLTACSACNTTNNYYLNGSTCSYCDPAQNKFMNGTTCQLCTLSQCLTCSSLTACSACNTTNNYYLNGSTCSYCDPAQNKFMNGTTCQLCTLSQCLTCSSLTACSACNTTNNYYLNGSTCSYCDPAQNKFMNGTTCQLCTLSQCLTCSSLTACSACNTTNNYYLNGSTCSYCDPAQNKFMNGTTCQLCTLSQCLTCSSLTACSACNTTNNYYLNGSTCNFCDPALNYFINSTTANCQPCQLTNCTTCSSLTACSVCDNSLQSFLNSSDSLCYVCSIPNCLTCNSLANCSICDTAGGYSVNSTTGLCSLCGVDLFINFTSTICQPCTLSQCVTCSSLTICSTCNTTNNYYLNGSTCNFCDPALNYFINSTTSNCQPCQLTNCTTCSSLTACSVCDNSLQSFLNSSDSLCYVCSIPNCLTCNSLANCSICDTAGGYSVNSTTGLCSLCGVDLFINFTSTICQPCTLSQCVTCSSLTICSTCNTTNNYYLNGSTCNFCDPALNYFINSTTANCQPCQLTNCTTCSSLTACSVCDNSLESFLNSSDSLCYVCSIPNCLTCNSLANCSICDTAGGYSVNSTTGLCSLCGVDLFINFTSTICQPCTLSQCVTCSSLTICSTCNTTNNYYLNGSTCNFCDPALNYFINSTTSNCQPCQLTNCTTCSSLTACSVCDNSLQSFLNSSDSLCYVCSIPNCLTCNSLANCSFCDTAGGYSVNSTTGLCSLCGVDLFINFTSTICQPCTLSQCVTCSSLTICSTCNTTNNYYLNGSTCNFCDPALNYFINSTTANCQPCQLTNCTTCSSLTACSVCDNSLQSFLNSSDSLCYICSIPNCLTCNSLANCSICDTAGGYSVNSTTGLCSLCGVDLFINFTSTICQPCTLSQCVTCSSLTICSTCNTTNNYYLNGSTCNFCDPALNYFINSTTANCQPCQLTNCTTCSSLTACSVCDNSLQSFLNSSDSLCYVCSIPNCLTCNSLANCSICDTAGGYSVNSTTGLCSLCGVDLFINFTSTICQPCTLSQCVTCSSLTICSTCNTTNNYYLNGSTCNFCDPALNYFINSTTANCQPCQLINCTTCSSLTACSVCDNSVQSFLNSTDSLCYPCSLSHCLLCSSLTSCLVCDFNNNFGLDYTSSNRSQCGPCNVSCSCDGYTTPWLSTSQTCTTLCGDGLIRLRQQCDDNNTDSGDGCSSSCTVQPYFACDQAQPTTCNETLFFHAQLISILKHGCNEFKVSVKITPQISPSQIVSTISFLNDGIIIKDVFDNNGAIQIVAEYIKDIANQTIKLKFSPGILLNIKYTPQIPALRYTEDQCKATQDVEVFIQAVQIASYIVLLFSLLSCKIIGLQLFGVLQLSYFTLSMQDFFVLYLAPLAKFRTFNGLNIQFTKQQTPLPTNFTRLSVASSFINNCNIMLILLFGQLIVSIVLYIIAKTTNRDKLRKVALRMLKQGFITLVIFNIFNISYSAGVHWKYASAADDGYILSSIILYGTLIAAIVATFAMCITDADDYGEFKNKFKHVWICRAYIPLTILYRAILGFYTAVQSDYSQGTLLIVGFAMAFMLYNIVNFPFYNTLQNYRATFVHITMLYTLLASNYYAGMKMNTPFEIKGRQYTVAIIQLVLIIVVLLFSFTLLIYQIYKALKQCQKNQQIQERPHTITQQSFETL